VCAVDGPADYLVSKDKDLLALGNIRGIPIISQTDFYRLLLARVEERNGPLGRPRHNPMVP
jgi:predicted nucleic acid-binding protein